MSPLAWKTITTTITCLVVVCGIAAQNAGQDPARPDAPKQNADKPIPAPYTLKSIQRGKQFYLINCVECHDQDGKGLGRRDFSGAAPADLTDPDAWVHGTTPADIFNSIHDGTKNGMPPFKGKLQDDQIWSVVNFVRSLWPEEKRPKIESTPAGEAKPN